MTEQPFSIPASDFAHQADEVAAAAMTDEDLYNQLAFYTLSHPDPSFVHQLVVDAYTAQHADATTKPIAIVFALVGLYLHVDKGFSGKQVQRAHMQLAKRRRSWRPPQLPPDRGPIRVSDVLAAAPGQQRDALIHAWCCAVWGACTESRAEIVQLVQDELGIR